MTFQPRNHAHGQSSRRRPLRTIADHNANVKRETPLIKTVLRETVKAMPPRPQTNTRRTATRRRPRNIQRHSPGQRISPNSVIVHEFSDAEQFDRAVRVFTHLPSIPGLAGISPRLYSQDRIQLEIQLRYPNIGIWRVVDRVHPRGDRHVARLRVHEVQQLRDTLLNDISILCSSRIAFNSDVGFLRIVGQRKPSLFLPVLDTFDLNQDADAIDWAELERDMMRKVESQFQVFEVRNRLRTSCLNSIEVADTCIQPFSYWPNSKRLPHRP